MLNFLKLNLNKILFFCILLLVIFLVYYFYKKNNSKKIENFSNSEVNNPIYNCNIPTFINVNYNEDTSGNNIYTKKSDDDDAIKNNIFIIEKNQPFEDDEVFEMKESYNFIWFLNLQRNNIVKKLRSDLMCEDYTPLFRDYNIIKTKPLFITGWGVTSDELYEYCILHVEDYSSKDAVKRYIMIISGDIDSVNLFNYQTNDNNRVFYLDNNIQNQIFGNIYLKYNKDSSTFEKTLFDIRCLSDTNKSGFTENRNLKLLHGKIIIERTVNENEGLTNITLKPEFTETDLPGIGSANYFNNINTNIISILENVHKEEINLAYILSRLFTNGDSTVSDKFLNFVKTDFENNYSREDISDNIKKSYLVNLLLTKKIFNSVVDFAIYDEADGEKIVLFLAEYISNGDINAKLSITNKLNIENIDNLTFTSDETIINEIIYTNDRYIAKNKISNIDFINPKNIRKYDEITLNKYNEFPLSEYYKVKYVNIGKHNIQGLLELKYQNFNSIQQPIIKDYINYLDKVVINMYFTIYQEVIKNKVDTDTAVSENNKIDIYYAKYNIISICNSFSMCIPNQKFIYDRDVLNMKELIKKDNDDILIGDKVLDNFSLLKLFNDNQNKNEEVEDFNKFKNPQDWIYIYEVMRQEGLYYPLKQDNELTRLNDSIINNNIFIENKDLWKLKHKKILNSIKESVYDEKSKLNIFPNISCFNVNSTDDSIESEQDVYIHLLFKEKNEGGEIIEYIFSEDSDLVDNKFHFLKLEVDNNRNVNDETRELENNQSNILGRIFNYYKLTIKPKNDVLNLTEEDRSFFIWKKKKINNFMDFKELVLGYESDSGGDSNINNESDSRDRLRGIYDLNDIYVDDYYIEFLKENYVSEITNERKNKIIAEKEKIRDKLCIDKDETNKLINRIGYPFIVFYKNIDADGIPCLEERSSKQRIYLSNRLNPTNIKKEDDNTLYFGLNSKYPLIKQEFLSFSGFGNVIQYYEKKYGGITNIKPKTLCGSKSNSIVKCEKVTTAECSNDIMSFVGIDGSPKCEIDDSTVKRRSEYPVEVLIPGTVPKNICDVFILFGDQPIYFTLGRTFGYNKTKFQYSNIYTIKDKNGKYLFYDDSDEEKPIKLKNEFNVTSSNGETIEGFKFVTNGIQQDNYGSYYLLKPKSLREKKYLTARIDSFQHTLGNVNLETSDNIDIVWTLESKKNITNRNYLNDEDFYSQKFITRKSLLFANSANDGETLPAELEKERQEKIKEKFIEAENLTDLDLSDLDNIPSISHKEYLKILEKLIYNINKYSKAKNRGNLIDIQKLGTQISQDYKDSGNTDYSSRISLIKERIHKLKYIIDLDNNFESIPSIYSEFEYPKANENSGIKNSNNNNNKMNTKEFKIVNALERIRDFVPKETKIKKNNKSQCKKLYEGFENIYSENRFNNHIVDKYNEFVVEKANNLNKQINDINSNLNKGMQTASNRVSDIKLDGKKEQLKLSQEIENSFKLEDTVHNIKNNEQKHRIRKVIDKINQIKKLKCELKDVNYIEEVKDHPKYNSIISREDSSLLNIYKLDKCDEEICDEERMKKKEKCPKYNFNELDKNMIFVNGGCLTYDSQNRKLNVEHCNIQNEKQHFDLKYIKNKNDMDDYGILNNNNELEKPYYIITKEKGNILDIRQREKLKKYSSNVCDYNYTKFHTYNSSNEKIDESIFGYPSDSDNYTPSDSFPSESNKSICNEESNNLCLHKENGEVSLRKCKNLVNQQWEYSDLTSNCN